ncbi:MAG TPA: lipoate protein ligase C-terminal domain-containing protein [Syntrophomonadaceae bacterium]|nr:lipoate protein ligase C-terminal domain-containing protein [Syntrophomonadaceae bacterium]
MSMKWRLFDPGPLSAAENMALDRVILTARSHNIIPNTVRFLQFSPHCVLVGYHQAVVMEIEQEYCHSRGIEINRRITGGGNLYWDESQLGWELVALRDTPKIPKRLEDMYRLMCESAIAGLRRLGVAAEYRPANDIEVNGRKICGTGGAEFGDAFLYQGSLLTDFDVNTMVAALKLPVKKLEDKQVKSFKNRVVDLKEVLGFLPPMMEIKKAMAQGFADVLGVKLVPGGLTPEEHEMLAEELPKFKSNEWVYGLRIPQQFNDLNQAEYKSSGGLIRVSLRLDRTREVIKSAFITGDFFAYPERSILDLEAALKNSSSRKDEIQRMVKVFFEAHKVRIPGVKPEDFSNAIIAAIEGTEDGQ